MKRIVRLTESDLTRIVRRVIKEQGTILRSGGADTKATFDDKPNLAQLQKTNPSLMNTAASIGSSLVTAAEGGMTTAGTNDKLMFDTLNKLVSTCNSLRQNYPGNRGNFYVAAVFAKVSQTIASKSTTGYTDIISLIKGELSSTALDRAGRLISGASDGKISISMNVGGVDGMLKTFGYKG
jgi:hypothetical protein